jgi:DNA-binding NarL/FixJ family response regulator
MKLFIVDDSEVLRDRLSEMASDIEGVKVVGEAENSIEALRSIDSAKPDVVILDLRMPGGDGIGALEALKKKKPPLKVIVFTNYPYLQYRKRCLDAGADFFFYKATEFEVMIDLLRHLAKVY